MRTGSVRIDDPVQLPATEQRLLSMSLSEEEIYQEHVLDHYEDPYHRGRIEHPTHHHQDDNPLCGDVVAIDLAIDAGGTIRDARFEGEG